MRSFNIPTYYRSSFISAIKDLRKINDPRKQDGSATILDFGPVQFFIARHFGFCYGVENAIEISYRALEENPGKRIFLLSQMIHNPEVNRDLIEKGVRFIMDTDGKQFIDWSDLTAEDIVIIPAFGTTLEIEQKLTEIGIEPKQYNTTCPFVEKVWNTSEKLGKKNFSVVIHGKHGHEETKATFSHTVANSPSVIVRDVNEARFLREVISGKQSSENFFNFFEGKYSNGFNPERDLQKLGVVNQTTMLATETQEIADMVKQTIITKYGIENYQSNFADTRDTLCYATNDNQTATYELLKQNADLAIVVGGYNSSNTSHIVELCETKFPTYFISSAKEIESKTAVNHFDFRNKKHVFSKSFLPQKEPLGIVLTSGASCPDTMVDEVMDKIISYFNNTKSKDEILEELKKQQ
ncbi:MAG: 4-hydroxy-3-methylbut-2-enyl diphosphate reductase [Flavobacteriales bacterium]|nr:4-hydroxy-3-methylbut-2-enyl diphosphate reductase [Flavobacteriales bacterium]